MQDWLPDSAFVVVVMHPTREISRTTWPSAAEAKRYMKTILQQGVPAASIRVYQTRMAKPIRP